MESHLVKSMAADELCGHEEPCASANLVNDSECEESDENILNIVGVEVQDDTDDDDMSEEVETGCDSSDEPDSFLSIPSNTTVTRFGRRLRSSWQTTFVDFY